MEINTINLVGRAGREPDVRYFESGSTVANFTLAVNRISRGDEPDWFNLEIWGKQAQIATDYVQKGSLVGITGSFKIDSASSISEERINQDKVNFEKAFLDQTFPHAAIFQSIKLMWFPQSKKEAHRTECIFVLLQIALLFRNLQAINLPP